MLNQFEKQLLISLQSCKQTRLYYNMYVQTGKSVLHREYTNIYNNKEKVIILTVYGLDAKNYLETKEYLPEGAILPKIDDSTRDAIYHEVRLLREDSV